MKKAVSLLLTLALILSMCIGLISCGNTNDDNTGNTDGTGDDNQDLNDSGNGNSTGGSSDNDNSTNEPFVVDLAGYVANIGNATALGIVKKQDSGASPVAACGSARSAVQCAAASTLSSEKNEKNKNYIVMSTTDYNANAPEADGTGLTKVTFTKTVTENATTEITGSKYVKANKGEISIHAIEGFVYSVYHNDALVYREIVDDDLTDKKNKKGVIVLDNLIDGIEYRVDYKGVGVETTITQDEIDGEVDKLYVLNGYTFISFVPEGESQRPSDSELEYDASGAAYYDKTDYFSNEVRQSFVIDNVTGYVYEIGDMKIEKIENNLIIIGGKIYDIRIKENDELEFYTVVRNETLTVSHYYKDIYGNKYIQNDYLDTFDEENATLYYTESEKVHLFSNEGVAIRVHTENIRDEQNNYIRTERRYYKVTENFAEVTITKDERYVFGDKRRADCRSYAIVEDGYFYSVYESGAFRVNLESFETEESPSPFYYTGDNGFYFDHKTIITYHYAKYGDTVYNLYYADLYGENALPHDDDFYYDHSLDMGDFAEKLIDDVKIENNGELFVCNGWKFRKTTLTETVFYKIIVGEDGKPQIVSENYIAPDEQTITLQPLNK